MVKVKPQQFLNYSMSKNTNILEEREREREREREMWAIKNWKLRWFYIQILVLTTQLFPKGNFLNYQGEINGSEHEIDDDD